MSIGPLRYIKGIGPRKQEVFKKLRVNTVLDLFYYFPARYEDRSNFKKIKEIASDDPVLVKGKVLTKNLKKIPYRFARSRKVSSIFEMVVKGTPA